MKSSLPSGRTIFKSTASDKVEDVQHESTSAMSHDGDNICPKCSSTMMPAKAFNIPVLFCDQCRVSHPQRA